jgi:hypothetical protein
LNLPYEFSFETGCNDVKSIEIFNIFINPYIPPAEFSGGSQNQSTFEYYQPNMMARQLGCGQVPPRLFLHEFLKPREDIKEALQPRRALSISAAPLFMHLVPLYQQQLLIPPLLPGGKNSMITSLMSQYIRFVLS